MRIVVIGRNGQVASAMSERARLRSDIHITCLGRPNIDLETPASIVSAVDAARPDVIVNAAAYSAVDKAEAEPGRAFAVNRDGAEALAKTAARLNVRFVHLSTDYVFSGEKLEPYVETDVTGPINVYGLSKLAGEQAVMAAHPAPIILRTSWVFSAFGKNFVKTMLRLGRERPVIRVVTDQIGNPTSATDIADTIFKVSSVILQGHSNGGIYHYCGSGRTSWYEFAKFIFSESAKVGGPSPEVEPIDSSEFVLPARRPANSSLNTAEIARAFSLVPASWESTARDTVRALTLASPGN
jgi:dTDP-4-dehydrorhamnose reductase